MTEEAMFPLGSVLFPHMPVALRVFEDRYLVMLARVLNSGDPEFGVVLIERGHEAAGGGDRRFDIGTMARITEVTPRDDDVALVAQGGRRVEVVRWLEEDPHPVAEVRDIPDLVWDDELTDLRVDAERTVRRVLARVIEFGTVAWDPDVELSDDPVEACWQLAAIAPLSEIDQLALLRSPTTRDLLTTVIALTLAAEPALTAPTEDAAFDEALALLLATDSSAPDGEPDARASGPRNEATDAGDADAAREDAEDPGDAGEPDTGKP
ncbi:LON peptidase substrate-binding domain-containing protein [Microbacterium sp. P01]|uniref:LON peptidase substrate-binding domain-containing protein n=1 Tax=Microbacterium sp. P01 TaxID=3366261 RepID=UPI00366D185B